MASAADVDASSRLYMTDWVVMQAKGVADAGSAAFRVSGLEVGGLFGSLLAGRISDALIARDQKGGNVGKRVQVGTLSLWDVQRSSYVAQLFSNGNELPSQARLT